MLSISSETLVAEAYAGKDLHVIPVYLGVQEETRVNRKENGLKIFPNPMKDQTILTFNNGVAGNVKASFYSITGKLLYEIKQKLEKGPQKIRLRKSNLEKESGLIIVRLEKENGAETNRIVLQ